MYRSVKRNAAVLIRFTKTAIAGLLVIAERAMETLPNQTVMYIQWDNIIKTFMMACYKSLVKLKKGVTKSHTMLTVTTVSHVTQVWLSDRRQLPCLKMRKTEQCRGEIVVNASCL